MTYMIVIVGIAVSVIVVVHDVFLMQIISYLTVEV